MGKLFGTIGVNPVLVVVIHLFMKARGLDHVDTSLLADGNQVDRLSAGVQRHHVYQGLPTPSFEILQLQEHFFNAWKLESRFTNQPESSANYQMLVRVSGAERFRCHGPKNRLDVSPGYQMPCWHVSFL